MVRAQTVHGLVVQALRHGRSITVTIDSDSMRPWLARGRRVTLAPPHRSLGVGDIVLCCRGDQVGQLHRIVARDGACVTTKGDACARHDSPASLDDVVGLCVAIDGHDVDNPTWRAAHRALAWLSQRPRLLWLPVRALRAVAR